MNINDHGFVRVAAATPLLKVADCDYNVSQIKSLITSAIEKDVQIICFPELSITGYTCADLFFQDLLLKKALSSLSDLSYFMADKKSLTVIVGLPLRFGNAIFNVAAVITSEGIVGLVPKIYIPNEKEFYEKRWFASGKNIESCIYELNHDIIPFGTNLIFKTPYCSFAIEICEDLWMPVPPSSRLVLNGADIIFNLSASNELVGKNDYRKSLVVQQSARGISGYVYASCGVGESTTDLVFSGSGIIAEDGSLLIELERFSLDNCFAVTDIDVLSLRHNREVNSNFRSDNYNECDLINCYLEAISAQKVIRRVNPLPFVPSKINRDDRLSDIFNIQSHGLAKRLIHTGIKSCVIGISGGLDSTLALLVAIKAFDLLNIPRENIYGITMPGFGTTKRTYSNALNLMQSLAITIKTISITDALNQHFKDIEHDDSVQDIVYENSQARERTQILMDYANKVNGLVIGTGNMSELALGWATYNGDHMSMYAVNTSVPKTLVHSLVEWIADMHMSEESTKILKDILDTPFSPELLPADKNDNITQITEDFVGPYELHDFFLHRMLRYGDSPRRIFYLAQQAFEGEYQPVVLLKWLKIFYRRFFSQQFKRSCIPDGPKIGSINLSPRGDWRMPCDASNSLWLSELESISTDDYL